MRRPLPWGPRCASRSAWPASTLRSWGRRSLNGGRRTRRCSPRARCPPPSSTRSALAGARWPTPRGRARSRQLDFPLGSAHPHQGAAQRLAKIVEETSGGRFRIEVFPGGQIMGPFECFDAASQGKIEAFMAGSYYWVEPKREPAFEWFSTVPLGMNPEGMAAWFYQGDGLKLWEEAYAAFNLVPRPGPAFAPQMAGWFKKKMNSVGDYKGL